jgi:hypothetical protein
MKSNSILKQTLSTILFAVGLYLTLGLFDLGIQWLINNAIFPMLNWFNRINFIFKLIVISFGGITLIYILFDLMKMTAILLRVAISKILVINKAIIVISWLLVLYNITLCLIQLWEKYNNETFGFWHIIEMVIISIFIIQINMLFVMSNPKQENINDLETSNF